MGECHLYSMTTLYSPGTRVWLSDDSQQQWIPAEVSSCTKTADSLTLVLVDENGKVCSDLSDFLSSSV